MTADKQVSNFTGVPKILYLGGGGGDKPGFPEKIFYILHINY